ncbi:MAG: 1,4-alpha-glucan branching protein GlgB [Pseudomonadales bacterium]|nr:1,4-alpha-glucan branching protein GlgB [Pseudomonadales bacterium]
MNLHSALLDSAQATELSAVLAARAHNPLEVLGPHRRGGDGLLRVLRPAATRVWLETPTGLQPLARVGTSPLFAWRGAAAELACHPRLVEEVDGHRHAFVDPYSFPAAIAAADLRAFAAGQCRDAHRFLGAHPEAVDGIAGTRFAVWAPTAERVSVVGDWNRWDGRATPMQSRGASGVWELFVPGVGPGALYKFELRHRDSGAILVKADPYGRCFECPPRTAAVVAAAPAFEWRDQQWLAARSQADWLHAPMSIYEVHAGSWRRHGDGSPLDYRELADQLIPYVQELGFTHIELMPVCEHPFAGSWGYQVTGYFAPASRWGSLDDFCYLVDRCHAAGIGVLLDWVPGHFPRDDHALARFDGSALYEHEDPRLGEHREWGTLIFNYGRNEVKSFLLSSAEFWLDVCHVDGLRVDAVASMLYLDYARAPGDWYPNRHGGNENLEAIAFLRELNELVHGHHPGALTMAEESTAWPMVSRPTYLGGLGFSMKWNMGWMNDTLAYMAEDPVHRRYHHDHLTFGLLYAVSENFILPLSHDEVVHGKRSLLDKMPGDAWQRFANLRLLFLYQFTHPGRKLLFMGGEFAQGSEWSHDRALDWALLEFPYQRGVQCLVGDLNRLYRDQPALHRHDFEPEGFAWIDCHDSSQSVIAFMRRAGAQFLVVVLNFTPVVRHGSRIGVPEPGIYREILNSDSTYYQGSDVSNGVHIASEPRAAMGHAQSLALTLPPLGGLVLARVAS